MSTVSLFESRNLQNAVIAASGEERSIVLDVSGAELLDSSALVMVPKMAEFFQARSGELVLFGVRPAIREVMSVTYVDHLVEIVSSESDAIARIQNPDAVGGIVKRLHNALIFRGESRYNVIPLEEISHLSANERTTIVHCTTRTVTASRLLKHMEARLPDTFLRVHKGYVVNTRFVRGLEYIMGGMYQVTLGDANGTRLPVGRVYAPALKSALEKLAREP